MNEHHKNVIESYVEFMGHQKKQSIIEINKMFEEVIKTKYYYHSKPTLKVLIIICKKFLYKFNRWDVYKRRSEMHFKQFGKSVDKRNQMWTIRIHKYQSPYDASVFSTSWKVALETHCRHIWDAK